MPLRLFGLGRPAVEPPELTPSPVVLVDGVQCIVWGHALTDKAVHHPYFGDRAKVEADLERMPGWDRGVVRVGGCERDSKSGRVTKLCAEQSI